jgi:hypothetical protein
VNPLRGESVLKAGEKTFRLVFDANGLCATEQALSPMSTDEIISLVAAETDKLTVLRGVLWGALQRNYPTLHLVEAGDIISDAGVPAVRIALVEGLKQAFGVVEGGDEENPPSAEDGIG